MSKYRNLKQYRRARPAWQNKKQRKRDEQMRTLRGRLIRFCQLKGITPDVTPMTVGCTMPSGVKLVLYRRPRRIFAPFYSRIIYGVTGYPWRGKRFRLLYLDGRAANRLFDRFGEAILELEGRKASHSAGDAEPHGQTTPSPVPNDPTTDPQKKPSFFARLTKYVVKLTNIILGD